MEMNYRRARKGGRNEMPKLLPFPRVAWRICFLDRYIWRMAFLMGTQLRARSGFTLDGRGMRERQRK